MERSDIAFRRKPAGQRRRALANRLPQRTRRDGAEAPVKPGSANCAELVHLVHKVGGEVSRNQKNILTHRSTISSMIVHLVHKVPVAAHKSLKNVLTPRSTAAVHHLHNLQNSPRLPISASASHPEKIRAQHLPKLPKLTSVLICSNLQQGLFQQKFPLRRLPASTAVTVITRPTSPAPMALRDQESNPGSQAHGQAGGVGHEGVEGGAFEEGERGGGAAEGGEGVYGPDT
jgi:hypothetical protein